MRLTILGMAALASVAFASIVPGDDGFFKKRTYGQNQCKNDGCRRKVLSDGVNGRKACSSFQRTTVTPCPVTTTVSTSCTAVIPGASSTTTVVVTKTDTSTATQVSTVTQSTDPTTIKSTETVTASESIFRRTFPSPTCSKKTTFPTQIPPQYRGCCNKPSDFAAACSQCASITPFKTTVVARTVTVTSSRSCGTATSMSTATVTSTTTVTLTSTATSFTTTSLPQETVTDVSTITGTTVFPPSPTGPTCYKFRVAVEGGAISRNFVSFGDIAFDTENVATRWGLQNPSDQGIVTSGGGFWYAVAPRADTGDANIDAIRITTDRDVAANMRCSVVRNRLQCTDFRDPRRPKGGLLRCNFRDSEPNEPTELFIGDPGTSNCRPLDILPVVQTQNCGLDTM